MGNGGRESILLEPCPLMFWSFEIVRWIKSSAGDGHSLSCLDCHPLCCLRLSVHSALTQHLTSLTEPFDEIDLYSPSSLTQMLPVLSNAKQILPSEKTRGYQDTVYIPALRYDVRTECYFWRVEAYEGNLDQPIGYVSHSHPC